MKLYLKSPSGGQGGAILINNKIDYSQYKKIYVTYTATLQRYSSASTVDFVTSTEGKIKYEHICYKNAITDKTTKSFDISQIDDFYIYIQSHSGDGAVNCNIYEVWLEK